MILYNSIRFLLCFQILAWFVPSALAQDSARPDPEMATGFTASSATEGQDFMIVTANPYATKAGYKILKKGGSAADAAIAAQLVLGLTEPQSSGLGGGAFILHYDAKSKELITLDGRETAPFLGGPFLFYKNGQPMDFMEGVLGGRSVGVPGTPMLLEQFHQLHGQLTWMELFDDAIKIAEEGFKVSPRLSSIIGAHKDKIARFPQTASYFLDPRGEPLQPGFVLKNPAYVETLKDYSFYGASRFYQGQVAYEIIRTVQNIEDNPGLLTARDFREYEIKKRKPVCGPYRVYIVCSMGEPSSGALTLLQILGMVEQFDLPGWGREDARSWHVLAEASRLAFADRGAYMADPDFVNTPGVALLDPDYLKSRSSRINLESALMKIHPGKPPGWEGPLYEKGVDPNLPGTSHISVIDAEGNVVSMTTTIEGAFGSHVMVGGFLLNNQLTDFSFSPFDDEEKLVANMVEPGKRPRSSMSPTIVFDGSGKPVLILGSAGGSNIIGYVAQRIIAVLDWGMEVQEALNMPNFVTRWNEVEMEQDNYKPALEKLGHTVKVTEKNSGLTAIHIKDGKLYGAADPRREGVGMGN